MLAKQIFTDWILTLLIIIVIGDDEQSDWVGEEWLPEEGDSAERRRDLIMRRLRSHAPSREIRAGKRRVHPQKPLFSCRTSANEQVSKFLQDPEQLELKYGFHIIHMLVSGSRRCNLFTDQ